MNHTPGPWRNMKEGAIIPLKSVYCERLGFQIGFVNTDRKSVETEAQCNAFLISAAPDLLSALSAMMTHMGGKENSWNKPTFDQARRAIAKATGKEQA